MTENSKIDLWERLESTAYYRPVAPVTVEEFFSEEGCEIYINYDHGKWWLKIDGQTGEDPYDTLQAAKEAGNTIVEISDNEMTDKMLANLTLSKDEWKLEIIHGLPVITSLMKDEITLTAGETSPRWSLLDGNEFVIETDDFNTALSKAKDLLQGPAPTL